MAQKTLIIYSSGYGTTKEVAETIGKLISENNSTSVELQLIDSPQNLDSFDTIIIGTSIRADNLLANTRDFISANKSLLKDKKLAMFILCLTANSLEGQEKIITTYTQQLKDHYPDLDFKSIAAFGGKIDFQRLNPVMQSLILQVFKKTGVSSNGSVDTRNWDNIKIWASQLKQIL